MPHKRRHPFASSPYDLAVQLHRAGRAPAGSAAALLVQAGGPWSPTTHALYPAATRAFAENVLRLGYQLTRSNEVKHGTHRANEWALLDIWMDHVMPLAVCRGA